MHRLAPALLAACFCAAHALAGPPAWHVGGEAGGELWLLGSVHYLREDDHPLPDVVDRLYSRADALVMELDLDDLDPVESRSSFLGAGLLPDGVTLEDRLGPELLDAAEQQARLLGFELRLLERFEPWLVAVTLLDRGMAQRGYHAEVGVESHLLGRAEADDKPVLGLETIDAQARVFDGLSAMQQQALLEQTLEELASPDDAIEALIEAWRDGRLDELAEGLEAEFEAFPRLYDALVVERNRNWVARLEEYLGKADSHLVVVGALHLVGEDSVVELLRERGFSVEPVD